MYLAPSFVSKYGSTTAGFWFSVAFIWIAPVSASVTLEDVSKLCGAVTGAIEQPLACAKNVLQPAQKEPAKSGLLLAIVSNRRLFCADYLCAVFALFRS